MVSYVSECVCGKKPNILNKTLWCRIIQQETCSRYLAEFVSLYVFHKFITALALVIDARVVGVTRAMIRSVMMNAWVVGFYIDLYYSVELEYDSQDGRRRD
jgi:hypothetical protein